jgi:hypothetical protein
MTKKKKLKHRVVNCQCAADCTHLHTTDDTHIYFVSFFKIMHMKNNIIHIIQIIYIDTAQTIHTAVRPRAQDKTPYSTTGGNAT